MSDAILLALLVGLNSPKKPAPKRKPGRPLKRFLRGWKPAAYPSSFTGWTYDRKGNPVAPDERRKRGQRKRIARTYNDVSLWRVYDEVEERRGAGTKRPSFRKALYDYMVEVYIRDIAPKPDPHAIKYQEERARSRREAYSYQPDPATMKKAKEEASKRFNAVRTALLDAQKRRK
jgi:hypothetical protein